MSPELALAIGNKNYSSWSMRPWVALRQAGIPFREIQLWFDDEARASGAEQYSPTGQVPVLLVDGAPVWDSLAICETAAELFPDRHLWPADAHARARARAVCAEMHAGFRNLRGEMPMNIRSSFPGKGMNPAVERDIERVCSLWSDCRGKFGAGGPLLFGKFSVADAYYAPVVTRFITYAPSLPQPARDYVEAVRGLPAVQEWMAAARRETAFVAADEPYAKKP
jgi:glutathione S-transferase